MIHSIFQVLWVFLPVGLGNSAPILIAKIPAFKKYSYPLDFYKTYRGKRILGDHKTIRGLISGIIVGILTVYLQRYIVHTNSFFSDVSIIDYTKINVIAFGTFCAIGALGGDAIKSFFKRQIGVVPGKTWFPFDQIDYIAGGIISTLPFIQLSIGQYALLIIVWFALHPLFSLLGYYSGFKTSRF